MTQQELVELIQETKDKKLTHLSLYNRGIEEVPSEIGLLTDLEELDLSENKLSVLPPEIAQLKNLKILHLDYNAFTEFPLHIEELVELKDLDLSKNKLTYIPASIGELKNLRKLILRANEINVIADEIRQLQHLHYLDLSENKLTQLSPNIGNLKKLTDLNLYDNDLETLPSSIANLSMLRHINVSYNSLQKFPLALCRLEQLLQFDLSNNEITHLPEQIGLLTNLTSFYLRENKIEKLPKEIGQLTAITNIDIANNQLKTLPSEIVLLYHLKDLELDENPLEEPLLELTQKGIYAIMLYFLKGIVVPEQRIFNISLSLPEHYRLPLKQYLVYFGEYMRLVKKQSPQFEVYNSPEGLCLELIHNGGMELDETQQSLSKYLDLIQKNNAHDEILFSDNQTEKEKRDIILLIRNQFRFLRKNLLYAKIEEKDFFQHLHKIYKHLVPQSDQARPNIDEATPGAAK
ncbi:MAG: leucine-rich repeat domain-containing protein [Chitinophagales bacterium]